MTDSSKPDSAQAIGKRPAEQLAFSEQVILFYGRYRRKKFWLLALLLPLLLVFIVPPLAAMSNPTGSGGVAALLVMALPSRGSTASCSPTGCTISAGRAGGRSRSSWCLS